MTDLDQLIDTDWDLSTCHCAECQLYGDWRMEYGTQCEHDYSHVKWFVGAALVWVTVATVYFLWS